VQVGIVHDLVKRLGVTTCFKIKSYGSISVRLVADNGIFQTPSWYLSSGTNLNPIEPVSILTQVTRVDLLRNDIWRKSWFEAEKASKIVYWITTSPEALCYP